MTHQHLLDNGYKYYQDGLGTYFYKPISEDLGIQVTLLQLPDGWKIWTPRLRELCTHDGHFYIIECVQWYNTPPGADCPEHNILDAEKFLIGAAKAMGAIPEEVGRNGA